MTIPFIKAHGAKNDFLLTWSADAALVADSLASTAVAICDRHTGVGADGWMIVTPAEESLHATIRLFNSDGSEPEMSGNGTRCAAALLIEEGLAGELVKIQTGAGLKELRLVSHAGCRYAFEMNMGEPSIQEELATLDLSTGPMEATLLNVGNPQCVVFVDQFPANWVAIGREIESHPRFPNRTNVSFVRTIDKQTIDVRFYERGAGETMSSGTGSTGAAAAAIVRGLVTSPVTVLTPAGPLALRRDGPNLFLSGPAEITAKGEFYL